MESGTSLMVSDIWQLTATQEAGKLTKKAAGGLEPTVPGMDQSQEYGDSVEANGGSEIQQAGMQRMHGTRSEVPGTGLMQMDTGKSR